MSAARGAGWVAVATAATAFTLGARAAGAQPLAARIAAAEGPVVVEFATRPAACGDGRELIALGTHLRMGGGSWSTAGGGWSRRACVHGPARVALTVHAGAVTNVRVRVGPAESAGSGGEDAGARGLGPVRAVEAAVYFVGLAERTGGRDAESAVIAAAVADSAEVWRPLLALARAHADEDVARAAAQWLGAAAPPEAVPAVAALFRDGTARRSVREGAAVALAFVPNGAGVPALEAAARGAAAAGGDDPWVRDRAVFWLGNAGDPRARATLRALAAADTAPELVRAQAIFTLGFLDRGSGDQPLGPQSDPNAAFLRGLYPALASARLQDRVVQSVAQAEDAASRRWLVDLAADARQPLAARKQALFWAGQQRGRPIGDLLAAGTRLTDPEMRQQYAFVLSQRDEDAAVEGLIAMARADADAGVRRQAIFWLGQSRSPRARTYLESVVAR